MVPAAPATAFRVTQDDRLFGDVKWLMYPLSASLHPTSLAIVLELLFQHEVDPSELTKCGGAKAFGAHTASWRTLARVAVAGTDMPREVTYNASKSVSEQVYTAMLGDCLPAQSTIDKQYDGFRSVAVAISIYLDRVVTPCRARRMFDRDGYQSFELTPYGRHLFESRFGFANSLHADTSHPEAQDKRPAGGSVMHLIGWFEDKMVELATENSFINNEPTLTHKQYK
eukprot:jgi/Tetstr1/438593/TSEL_027144.t1